MAGLEWLQAAGTVALARAVTPSGERRLGGAEMEVAAAGRWRWRLRVGGAENKEGRKECPELEGGLLL